MGIPFVRNSNADIMSAIVSIGKLLSKIQIIKLSRGLGKSISYPACNHSCFFLSKKFEPIAFPFTIDYDFILPVAVGIHKTSTILIFDYVTRRLMKSFN